MLADEDHEILLASADACLLSEKTHRGEWLSTGICFASKMLSYMKHAKPLLVYSGESSEVRGIVQETGCGFYLKHDGALKEMLQDFVGCEDLQAMGLAGHVFYESFLSKYKPMTWIQLMERRIEERQRIENEETSFIGKTGKIVGENTASYCEHSPGCYCLWDFGDSNQGPEEGKKGNWNFSFLKRTSDLVIKGDL